MGVTRPPGYGTHPRHVVPNTVNGHAGPPARIARERSPSPQQLILTLLGDYWTTRAEALPLGAIVRLLAEFNVSEGATRAAIQRMASRGLLVSSRRGRRAYYAWAPGKADETVVRTCETLGFASSPQPWNRRWTLLMFRLGEDQRETRHGLYASLRRLGFGPLYDGVWISPRADATQAVQTADDLAVRDITVMEVSDADIARGNPRIAWDLTGLATEYQEYDRTYRPLLDNLPTGEPGQSVNRALAWRTRAMTDWRRIPSDDPRLPDELLPEDWPRAAAFETFEKTYVELGPAAARQVRDIVALEDPDLAELVVHRTVSELIELGRQAIWYQSVST